MQRRRGMREVGFFQGLDQAVEGRSSPRPEDFDPASTPVSSPPASPPSAPGSPVSAPLVPARRGGAAGPTPSHRAAALPDGPEGHRKRLRERLLRGGADALADYELLEMVLFAALPRGDTKPLSKVLIARFGSFGQAVSAPEHELRGIEGVGDAVLAALRLARAAALRLLAEEVRDRPVLGSWERLSDYLTASLARERVEQFRVLFLDTRNRLLADEVLGRGTVNHTPAYPREVVKRCLELGATAIILVHNHPSGDATPSRADRTLTAEISDAARLLGVAVHDHLIVGGGSLFSFRREGLL